MARVNVVYHFFPHYRRAVLRALVVAGRHDYRFWGAHQGADGIEAFRGDALVAVRPLHFRRRGRWWSLRGHLSAVLDRTADALLILGNPNMPASWTMAIAGRLTGKKIVFWAHGWLRPEGRGKARVRNAYFGLADRVLVYGDRAAELAARSGFDRRRVSVVYNSLDAEGMGAAASRLAGLPRAELRDRLRIAADARVLISSARLTSAAGLDLLLRAAAALAGRGQPVVVVLIGDGPEAGRLRALAEALAVDARFAGATYDDDVLAAWYGAADLCVSPGKAGLTAIQSLGFGIPVVTHGDMDRQMPEAEAIEPGRTGALFERGNVDSLAETIERWFGEGHDPAEVRRACEGVIRERYNPVNQARLIGAAIDEVLDGR